MKEIARGPYYLLLLPAFFMLHCWTENPAPGLLRTVLLQTLLYAVIGVILTGLFYFLFKNILKAALAAFLLLTFNFFFGALQDLLRSAYPNSFINKYGFLIPFFLLILLISFALIKKAKGSHRNTTAYLNGLFLILVLIDMVRLPKLIPNKKEWGSPALSKQFRSCDSCSKPDVYFIIADEYAGKKELEEIFAFDNSDFEVELGKRGFRVLTNSVSNYNATVYSVASMLAMDELDLSGNIVKEKDMFTCRAIINDNNVLRFFKQKGYGVFNYSFFEFGDRKKAVNNYYFPSKARLFNAQTFVSRARKDLGFHLFSVQKVLEIKYHDLLNDQAVDSLTRAIALQKNKSPKFVYAHYNMPHYPYYFDRNGNPNHADSLKGFERVKIEYTEYLLRTNQVLLSLIDHIQKKSEQPPVIILASDHGFRQFPTEADRKYYFMNLCAVYLPNGNYAGFYDGLSGVNLFRAVLNGQFGQVFPITNDSTVFLIEPTNAH